PRRARAAGGTSRARHHVALREPLSAELHHKAGPQLWQSLVELDAYRKTFEATPDTLTKATILGSLTVALRMPLRGERPQGEAPEDPSSGQRKPRKPPALKLGE